MLFSEQIEMAGSDPSLNICANINLWTETQVKGIKSLHIKMNFSDKEICP